jgi:hypothetical protein
MRNEYKILVGKLREEIAMRIGRRRENNIKMM